ncbi:MAG: hypothetical protein WDO56_01695 [Gammaproteobacteria bacterium]
MLLKATLREARGHDGETVSAAGHEQQRLAIGAERGALGHVVVDRDGDLARRAEVRAFLVAVGEHQVGVANEHDVQFIRSDGQQAIDAGAGDAERFG